MLIPWYVLMGLWGWVGLSAVGLLPRRLRAQSVLHLVVRSSYRAIHRHRWATASIDLDQPVPIVSHRCTVTGCLARVVKYDDGLPVRRGVCYHGKAALADCVECRRWYAARRERLKLEPIPRLDK